jgi:hemolysin III
MNKNVIVREPTSDSGRHSALLVRGASLDSGCRLGTSAQSRDEELVNSITHGLGLVLSIAGLSTLLTLAGSTGTTRYAVGCCVYGASLVLLYAASTLFHSWPDGEVKRVFLVLDHIGIYVLIAGTYTPMAMFASLGKFGCSCLTAAWGFALVGSFAKVIRAGRLDHDSSMPYVAMSGLCLLSLPCLVASLSPGETTWLLAGGLFYAGGMIFFFNAHKQFYHSIWHLFVLAGTICHYQVVLGYVISATF